MRALALTALLAACHPQPPPQPQPPTERSAVEMRRRAANMKPISRVSAPIEPATSPKRRRPVPEPPPFDPDSFLPDVTPILRWPLTVSSHPDLAPQFAIADALAEPGLDWTALCRLGAHHRRIAKLRDQIAYLRGWCAASEHDVDAAIRSFAPLTRSVVPGLAPAVRMDIVHVLIDHGTADDALRLLAKYQLRNLAILDLLAATFHDLGKLDDAAEINAVAIVRDDLDRGRRCHRQARRVAMAPEPYRSALWSKRNLFDEPTGADRTCDHLEAQLACWLRPKLDCAPYFTDRGIDPRTQYLIQAHESWPADRATGFAWLWTADFAINAGTVARAYDFAVLALEMAVRSDECSDQIESAVQRRARWLRSVADRPTGFEQRLRILETDPDLLCD